MNLFNLRSSFGEHILTKLMHSVFLLIICAGPALSQGTQISGSIGDQQGESLIGVNILVKGKVIGTITNLAGEFYLDVNDSPPLTLIISMVGFATQELDITSANSSGLEIVMEEQTIMGQEVVVSASRMEESILESPVSIEKMDILAIRNTAADNYYKGIANLKGVDVATSSINFQIINARGFAGTSNTRFVQLIDGMDTQAPALNFPIGSLNGPSELDVESLEVIPGAMSALYGPNAFNGVLLITSKSPFEYQGLSAFAKTGVNHVGKDADQGIAPIFEGSVRYAKAFNNKLAFKLNLTYMQADDWHGTSDFDRNAEKNPFVSLGADNIGADRLHFMGDEAALNMNILRFSATTATKLGWETIAYDKGTFDGGGNNAWTFAQAGFLPNHVYAAPAYQEQYIVDYGAENTKINGGLFYRVNDQMELSYLYNAGFGTSVYTGAQRYSLAGFGIQQHRLQLRGDNFFMRAYATLEKSGGSYIAEFLGKKINDVRYGGNVSNYLTEYPVHYLRYLYDQGYRVTDNPGNVTLQEQLDAHNYARNIMTTGEYALTEGTPEFEAIKNGEIDGVVPFGPKFDDFSNMYHAEFQYDFKNEIEFMSLQSGASFRTFDLNSNGTIFDDEGGLKITEYGLYAQAGKKLMNDKFKLSGSMRYDKSQNFEGQFSPRIAAVITVAPMNNIRLSYQTGFRIPTTQGQYIDLNILTSRLLGGLSEANDKYGLTTNAYTRASVNEFTKQVFSTGSDPADPVNTAILIPFTEFTPVIPEQVKSFEIGYKSLISNDLMIDAYYYFNNYTDFITQNQVRIATDNVATTPSAASSLLNGTDENTFSYYTNFKQRVTSQGAAIGVAYALPRNFNFTGNYSWNVLNDEIINGLSEFNTPAHKVNLGFGNRKITDNLGFNVTFRWQEGFRWESSFAIGDVPSYKTVDAQLSYKLPDLKSVVKIGGSNIINTQYIQSLGGPNIGALYYISLTFDEIMN